MFEELLKLSFLSDPHVVGGAVRDHLLNRESDDVDIATSDTPEEVVHKCQTRGLKVPDKMGQEHGTVFVVMDDQMVEVTTFRKDLKCDGRHAEVEFTDDLHEDLARRDFTINAMAMNGNGRVIDPFNGKKDLIQGRIRTVGNPRKRFREDLLRIIRGARFSGRFDYSIHSETMEAMHNLSDQVLDHVAIERVTDEMKKAFSDEEPSNFLEIMFDLGILQELIPEFEGMDQLEQNPEHHPEGDVFTHICNVVDRAPSNWKDRFRALLHDIGKTPTAEKVEGEDYYTFHGHESKGAEIAERVAEDLKLSNDMKESLRVCTRYHMHPLHAENQGSPISDKQIRRFQRDVEKHIDDLQTLCKADHERGDSPLFDEVEEPIKPILMGRHLIERGHDPGPHFGDAIDAAFEKQINEGITDIEKLYKIAKPHLDKAKQSA